MRTSNFSVLKIGMLALLSPFLSLAQTQNPEIQVGAISGKVLLEGKDKPVRYAQVEFLIPSTGQAILTQTDQQGNFDLSGLSPTSYKVTATATGCERLEEIVNVDRGTGTLLLRVRKAQPPVTPRNDAVVSVQELSTSEKAVSYFAKGTQLLQKQDAQRSIQFFQRALAKDPGYYRAYHNLGLAHYKLGLVEQAEEDFQKAIDVTSGGYAPSDFALGMIFCEKGQYRQAQKLIENGLAMDPGSALGKYFLGIVQFALSRFQDAEKSARDALWRSGKQADVYILLAKIHERENRPQAVMADVASYRELEPNGPLLSEANELLNHAQSKISQAPR